MDHLPGGGGGGGGGNLPEDQQAQDEGQPHLELVAVAVAPPSLHLRRASISSLDECSQKCDPRSTAAAAAAAAAFDVERPCYKNSVHGSKCLDGLSGLQKNGILTDVTLVAGNTQIKAHKNVLAACSPYFYAMFRGGRENGVVTTKSCLSHIRFSGLVTDLKLQHFWLFQVSRRAARIASRSRTWIPWP